MSSSSSSIIVKTGAEGGQLVRLSEVARIELGAQNYAWYAELDGATRRSPWASISCLAPTPSAFADGVYADAMEDLADPLPQRASTGSMPYDATRLHLRVDPGSRHHLTSGRRSCWSIFTVYHLPAGLAHHAWFRR